MQLPAEQLNIYRGTSSQKYTENTEIKKWKIKTKKYISCPSLTVRALWQWSKFMASVQRCKNGTHSRQIQKKKGIWWYLYQVHVPTPLTHLHTIHRQMLWASTHETEDTWLKTKQNKTKKKHQEGGTPSPTRPVQNKRRRMTVTWSISKANINFTFTQISH